MKNFYTSKNRPKIKQMDGIITKCSSRIAKSGNYAHSFFIGEKKFSLFNADDLSPVVDGDRVRFEYEIRRLKSGYRAEYYSIIPETLSVVAPQNLEMDIEGQVYILSNVSMPGILKIGYTLGSATKRAAELSGVTSIPTGFKVEWILPVAGDARIVEQRAHALLAKNLHGKEFFKISLEEAKSACIQSFVEIYPERAKNMDQIFSLRAEKEIQRREKLNEIKIKAEENRKHEESNKIFEQSLEGRWRKEGKCLVILSDFRIQPDKREPSWFLKLLKVPFDDYLEIKIVAQQWKDVIQWVTSVSGRFQKTSIWATDSFSKVAESIKFGNSLSKKYEISNCKCEILISNLLIENPPPLPSEYQNPETILTIPTIEGLIIRPSPEIIRRRKKFNS
jgi:hypothetical protein